MKPWKRLSFRPGLDSENPLQWGHGDEAVEEAWDSGNIQTLTKLQWGHGDEAVEEHT